MNRAELVEAMVRAYVGPDVFLLIDEDAKERRRGRMAAVLDAIEPLIRADERARIVERLIPSPPEDAS